MPDTNRTDACSVLVRGDAGEDRLVAIFGHELRSHIAPIKNAAELLRRATLDPALAQRAAAIIERQVDGMARLVDELVAFAQLKTSPLVMQRCETVVETIVKRCMEMIQPLATARGQTLSIQMPAETIYIEADELWLTQAVQNVIGNAVKYTDPGGQIEIEVLHCGASVQITVRDTGIGLGPTEIKTVFDLYARGAQPAARPTTGGLGVGLHLAEFVIAAHGGSIRAMSDGVGRGSTFVIRLPCRAVELSLQCDSAFRP